MKIFITLVLLLSSTTYPAELTLLGSLWPAGSVEIESKKITGILKKNKKGIISKVLFIKIKDLDSNVTLRNQHIHKFLGFPKFKRIYLRNLSIKGNKGRGELEIKDVKKNIFMKVKWENKNKVIIKFHVNLDHFNLPQASYMGVQVKRKLSITVNLNRKDFEQ